MYNTILAVHIPAGLLFCVKGQIMTRVSGHYLPAQWDESVLITRGGISGFKAQRVTQDQWTRPRDGAGLRTFEPSTLSLEEAEEIVQGTTLADVIWGAGLTPSYEGAVQFLDNNNLTDTSDLSASVG